MVTGSCEKQPSATSLDPFYIVTVNGTRQSVPACGTSDHVAQYLRDTAVFAAFGCSGQRAGFYLEGRGADGTYHLDDHNQAWYDEEPFRYTTDSIHQGSLTLRTRHFEAPGGIITYIEGEISFNAIDRASGQTIRVTKGKYRLKKYKY